MTNVGRTRLPALVDHGLVTHPDWERAYTRSHARGEARPRKDRHVPGDTSSVERVALRKRKPNRDAIAWAEACVHCHRVTGNAVAHTAQDRCPNGPDPDGTTTPPALDTTTLAALAALRDTLA